MNNILIPFKSITSIEYFILISTIIFAFMPLEIVRAEILGEEHFDFYYTIYNPIIISYNGGFSEDEIKNYISLKVPVLPKVYGSLVIGFTIAIISFVCMRIRHSLCSIWFFLIFGYIIVVSYLIFFRDYNRTGQIMFFPEKLILLIYAFCNLYVGYKKVRGRYKSSQGQNGVGVQAIQRPEK